ncbi:MAG: KH domain-containing protein, partial [bacterium]|nr:KH domain-containing protein [bacterium]
MIKNIYTGKTKEEAIQKAKISLQELEQNLYIKEIDKKTGLFHKKVEIEVLTRDEVIKFVKQYIKDLIKNMGLTANLEVQKREESVTFTVFSDNNSILIGKNGKTLEALTMIVKQAVKKEIGTYINLTIDIGEYKKEREHSLQSLAKKIAREVASSKVAAKLDPMNSYERRIIHTIL